MQSLNASKPWLVYAYPWQPFPRRLVIYLRERVIPSSLVTVVPVSDVQFGDKAPENFPPRPAGSLPILMIPEGSTNAPKSPVYIKQSVAIMEFLDETCSAGRHGFPRIDKYPILPIKSLQSDPGHAKSDEMVALFKARHSELLSLANGLTEAWNPIRTFGSGTGTLRLPDAAHEMFKWLQRGLASIENWMEENEYCPETLRWDAENKRDVTIAEVVLFQFFDFTKDCYGVDMTQTTGTVIKDVYGRDVRDAYPKLKLFYESFLTRPSARRDPDAGDVPHENWIKAMRDWSPGVFSRESS